MSAEESHNKLSVTLPIVLGVVLATGFLLIVAAPILVFALRQAREAARRAQVAAGPARVRHRPWPKPWRSSNPSRSWI